jgi:hypothetical protein
MSSLRRPRLRAGGNARTVIEGTSSMSDGGASEQVRNVVGGHTSFRTLSKADKAALEQSLAQMTSDESLAAYGKARTVEGGGMKSDGYTYYLVTDRGIYFGASVKTGFLKKETRAAFVASDDVKSAEIKGPDPGFGDVDMAFVEGKGANNERVLWVSFDDIAGNVGRPHQLAVDLLRGLGMVTG